MTKSNHKVGMRYDPLVSFLFLSFISFILHYDRMGIL